MNLDEIKKKLEANELSLEDLDQVSGGKLTESEINKIRDHDVYSLTREEKKHIYYRMQALRNAHGKSLEECKKTCVQEFHRFAIKPVVEEFIDIWYPRNIKVTDFGLYLSLYDAFGEEIFN